MTVEQGIGDSSIEKFPIGMRVLAVDDDPTCLLLLETLLRRCQYNVTTTSQATTALRIHGWLGLRWTYLSSDSKADLPCQVGLATVSSRAGQLINNGPLGWDDHSGCNLDANSLFFQRTTSFSSTGLSNFVDTSMMKHNEVECSAMETLLRSRDGYLPSQEEPQDGSVLNNFGFVEDLVSVMVNQPFLVRRRVRDITLDENNHSRFTSLFSIFRVRYHFISFNPRLDKMEVMMQEQDKETLDVVATL
ncbi:hypothetical protein OIU77_001131 [Salix suchowensis]|uniref:Response regulatory domain-containing protein n=1 Tax=Salix suchowensis TaxID=1278906 RepID=A0ABQ8ZGL0_9ROSI|nr:hypothetical protein OIU77_001131 [Salix suchowensis]